MKTITSVLISVLLLFCVIQSFAQTQANLEYNQAVQQVLKTYDYYSGPIDGTVGLQTSAALIKFQRDVGIPITGTADAATAKAMIDLLKLTPSKETATTPSYGSTWEQPGDQTDTDDPPAMPTYQSTPSLPPYGSSWSQTGYQSDTDDPPKMPAFQNTLNPPVIIGTQGEYLGSFNANRYDPNSVSNPYGQYGSPYSPESINNPYGQYGSQYSQDGATNPYTNGGAKLFGSDGQYLGRVNANQYDPESISNPYGAYGSKYSPTSVNNPYGVYGSPYSPQSVTNPYSTTTKPLIDWDK